ncbi:unnamed protein product [Schistosoma turkestanicum]|nr:unnamed protein product [Schistosoma turkestanicum]
MSANIGNEYGDGAYEDANDAAGYEAVNGDAGYAAQNEGAANEAADRPAEHAETNKGAEHEEANQNVGDELQNKHIVECLRLEKLYFTKWAKHYLSESIALFKKKLQDKESEIKAQIGEVKLLEWNAVLAAHEHMKDQANKELNEKQKSERKKLIEALDILRTLMKESEYLRILLIKVSSKNEQIQVVLRAMEKDSNHCTSIFLQLTFVSRSFLQRDLDESPSILNRVKLKN